MPKEKTPQDGRSIRGDDNLIITEKTFDGNIPADVILDFQQEAVGLTHGIITLAIHVKDGHLNRYSLNRERSIVPDKPRTGSTHDK